MWDQFESSARLLPSPEENKGPEASSRKQEPGFPPPVAKEDENTLAFGGVQQDLFPSSDAEQATFAFSGTTGEEETPVECPGEQDGTAMVAPAFQEQSQAPVISTTDNTEQIKEAVAIAADEAVETAGDEAVAGAGDEAAAAADDEGTAGDDVLEVPLEELVATPANSLVAAPADISVPAGGEKLTDQETKTGKVAKTETAAGVRDGKEAKTSASRDPRTERPFRVKLRGSVLVLVRLPNKRSVRGAFHQLSTSGGVIHLEKPLDEKLEVELIFHIQEKTIRNHAQMLFPMWATQGWMQPFRFVDLADKSREILDASLKAFLGDLTKSASAGA